jgi:hypothetical protein
LPIFQYSILVFPENGITRVSRNFGMLILIGYSIDCLARRLVALTIVCTVHVCNSHGFGESVWLRSRKCVCFCRTGGCISIPLASVADASAFLDAVYGPKVEHTNEEHETETDTEQKQKDGYSCITSTDQKQAETAQSSLLYGELLPEGVRKVNLRTGCMRLLHLCANSEQYFTHVAFCVILLHERVVFFFHFLSLFLLLFDVQHRHANRVSWTVHMQRSSMILAWG